MSAAPTLLPSTRNCTLCTPTLSDAVAVSVVVPATSERRGGRAEGHRRRGVVDRDAHVGGGAGVAGGVTRHGADRVRCRSDSVVVSSETGVGTRSCRPRRRCRRPPGTARSARRRCRRRWRSRVVVPDSAAPAAGALIDTFGAGLVDGDGHVRRGLRVAGRVTRHRADGVRRRSTASRCRARPSRAGRVGRRPRCCRPPGTARSGTPPRCRTRSPVTVVPCRTRVAPLAGALIATVGAALSTVTVTFAEVLRVAGRVTRHGAERVGAVRQRRRVPARRVRAGRVGGAHVRAVEPELHALHADVVARRWRSSVTVPAARAPAAGAVIDTVGAVVSAVTTAARLGRGSARVAGRVGRHDPVVVGAGARPVSV